MKALPYQSIEALNIEGYTVERSEARRRILATASAFADVLRLEPSPAVIELYLANMRKDLELLKRFAV